MTMRLSLVAGSTSGGNSLEHLEVMALVRLSRVLRGFGAMRASRVSFWMRTARFSRHERLTMRSASMDSMGPNGSSSSTIS